MQGLLLLCACLALLAYTPDADVTLADIAFFNEAHDYTVLTLEDIAFFNELHDYLRVDGVSWPTPDDNWHHLSCHRYWASDLDCHRYLE